MDTSEHRQAPVEPTSANSAGPATAASGSASPQGGLRKASPAGLSPCWSCSGPLAGVPLFCATCGAVQPPGQLDHFTRLELPKGFAVDVKQLNRCYFERQRLLHPDRFATASPRERALSQSQATALNEAYETLKDPLRRADYLLTLGHDGSESVDMSRVNDMALLQEALELREALAEAESVDDITALAARTTADIERCSDELAEAFAGDDRNRAAGVITRLKYLRKLADDCRARRQQLSRS